MSKLVKSLLAATAVLSLVPTTAFARPPPCEEQCHPDINCDAICLNITNTVITCGSYGLCQGLNAAPSSETASVIQDEAQQPQGESLVCNDASQPEALPVSVQG
ncbi:hypothetical protein [Corallococcus aberystwythensis]|uniref:hypothetical protein n=1 Tax=Corallococcus aberystwythensis TaxID=2316722 RepID=UPI0011C35FB2|nr:hypothetical protein [Corallococcus aberystwythensis]